MNIQGSSITEPLTPIYKMRSEDFVRAAIAISVNPAMVGGTRRLVATDDSQPACLRLHGEFGQLAPAQASSDPAAWASAQVDKLFGMPFQEDVWHLRLPCGRPVVLVKAAVMDERIDLNDVLRRVHVSEVTRAISDGLDVPSAVLDDYRVLVNSIAREVN